MGHVTSKPLEELAAALCERGCRARVYGGTLAVHPPASVRGERVIACDGLWFRWGGERGTTIGPVGDVAAAADAAAKVLRLSARWV